MRPGDSKRAHVEGHSCKNTILEPPVKIAFLSEKLVESLAIEIVGAFSIALE
jgi:hypothetical protein